MFVGHYAPAFALKSRFPEVPLGRLFVAAQAVDILFFVLVPLGVERMHLDPKLPGFLMLRLEYLPFSHSLAAALGFGALVAIIGRSRESAVLGVAVASHWFFDLLVHTPDLPLASGVGARVGLGLWSTPVLACVVELGLLLAAFALWYRVAHRGLALAATLVGVHLLSAFVLPPPPSVLALAASSELAFVGFAFFASRVDRAGRVVGMRPSGG